MLYIFCLNIVIVIVLCSYLNAGFASCYAILSHVFYLPFCIEFRAFLDFPYGVLCLQINLILSHLTNNEVRYKSTWET